MVTAKQRAHREWFARTYGGKKKRSHRSRSGSMGKKKSYHKKGSKKLFGLGTKGLIAGLGILGVGAAFLFSDQISSMIPVVKDQSPMVRNAITGFGIAGPAGAVAAVAKGYFMGGSSGTGGMVYY